MNREEALRTVPWLAALSNRQLEDVATEASRVDFRPGNTIVGELEAGDDLYVLVAGEARVTVAAGGDARRIVGKLSEGDACGEISMLTRELRSATVTATTDVVALRFDRAAFQSLLERHPTIALHFARAIAERLAETTDALDELTTAPERAADSAFERLTGRSAAVVPSRGSVRRAWRELVVARRRELPVLALLAFVATLVALRGAIALADLDGDHLFFALRAAYTSGIVLVFVSAALSLARFRPGVQRAVALAFGVGFALLLNELSVFLAFDTFYLDMTTRDPAMLFDVETLYRRGESEWALSLMLAFLVQIAALRGFYRRTFFVARARVRAALGRRR